MSLIQRTVVLLSGLWWGSLCTLGFLVVPLLFFYLPTPALAGGVAAKLFSAQNAVSVTCGWLLLILTGCGLRSSGDQPEDAKSRTQGLMWVFAALTAALLVEFVVAPHILASNDRKLWHTLGSGLYLVQCVCTAVVFWRSLPVPSVIVGSKHA